MKKKLLIVLKAALIVGIAAMTFASCVQPTGMNEVEMDAASKYYVPLSPTPTVVPYEELAPLPPEWSDGVVYTAGDLVTYGGAVWEPLWWNQGQPPVDSPWGGPWRKVADLVNITIVPNRSPGADGYIDYFYGHCGFSIQLLDDAGAPLAYHPVRFGRYNGDYHMTNSQGYVDLYWFEYETHPGRIYYSSIIAAIKGGVKNGVYFDGANESYPLRITTGYIMPTVTPTFQVTITPTPPVTITPTPAITVTPVITISPTPEITPTPVSQYPEWVTGTVDPVNGDRFTYLGHVFEARNNPGMWETPVIGGNWFWIDLGPL